MDVHYPSPAWLQGSSTDAFQQFYNNNNNTPTDPSTSNAQQPQQQQLTPPSAASNLSLNLSALSVTAASNSTPVNGSPHLSAGSATMSPGSPQPPQQQQQNYPFQHPDWFDTAAQQQSQQQASQQQPPHQQPYLSRRPSQSLRKKRSDVLTIEESSLEDIAAAASHHGNGPHGPMELVNPNFDDAEMPFAPVSDNSPIETNSGTEQQDSDQATSFSVIGKSSAPNNFVAKLYHMINDSKSAHFISWTEPGTSFVVSNVGEFSRSILGAHFKHNNFSSFVRQLNMYGFHKINRTPRAQRTSTDAQTWEFSHHKFLRGRPDLLEEIKRKALDASSSSPLAGLFGSSALGGPGSGAPGSSSMEHHAHLNGVRGAYGAELARLEVQIGRISATEGRVNAVEGRVRNLEAKVNNGPGAAGAIAEVWELFRRERERNQRLVGVVKMLYEVVGRGYAGGELPLPFPNDLLLDPEPLPDRSGTDPTIFITSPSDPSLMSGLDVTTPQPSSAASQSFQHAYYPQRHSPNSSPTSADFQSPATPGSARYRDHRDFRSEFRDLPHSFGGLPQSAPGPSSAMASAAAAARHPLVHRISFESNTSSSSRYEGRYESSHARFDSSSSVPPLSSSPSLDQLSSSSNDGRPGTSGTDGRPSNKRQRTEHSPENMNMSLAMDKSMSNIGLSLGMDMTPSSAPSSVTNGSVLGFTPSSSPFSSAASVSSVTTFGSNVPTTPGASSNGVGIGVPSGATTTPTTPGGGPHRKISRARSDSAPMGMGLGSAFRTTSYGSGNGGTMNISASLSGGLRPRSGSVMAGGANGYGAGTAFNLGGDGAFRPILSGVMVKDEALHMR